MTATWRLNGAPWGGAAPGGGPPSGTVRPPISASPNSPAGPPYPGPDVTPMDRQERRLVQDLLKQGKGEEDVRRALAERRGRIGATQVARQQKENRNKGLPAELSMHTVRYPDNTIDGEPALHDRTTTPFGNPKRKVKSKDFAVHHLWSMETVRKHLALFAAAARAGWNPDEAENVFAAPKTKAVQERIEDAMGERRPIHDNGHKEWNIARDAEAGAIEKKLEGLPPGPEYDQQARRLIEESQRTLRGLAKTLDRITMLPGAATAEAV